MNDLTIAIVEENCFKIGELMDTMPSFEDKQSAQNALVLIEQAKRVVESARTDAFNTMQKIKQTRTFLRSDEANKARFIG